MTTTHHSFHPSRLPRCAAGALALALAVAGCSATAGGDEGDAERHVFAEAEPGAFPVTVEHALGSTTIEEQPERVVVIGWAGADLAVALGTVPVAQGVAAGIDADHYPWFAEAVEELGGVLPAVDPSLERGEVDIEYVLEQDPDLVLAIGSGISEVEYERLSEIAPTVAYPDGPWETTVPEHLALMGEALGRSDRAAEIVEEMDERLAASAAAHPELDGLSFLNASIPAEDGSVVVFSSADQRTHTLEALGLEPLPQAEALLAANDGASSFVLGLEELRELAPDVFVTVATDDAWQAALDAQPVFASWAPVADGRAAPIADPAVGLAFSTATPLALSWGLDEIVEELLDATD
ncbi:iron complex transport system substrate-binding protein [Nocardioides zeae]|uniref:Iron complex transport system substrate-binding protein n=2 Tax=Nocardioides zeae TaxID=1457234 RepID=A0AAJ1TZI7_9ACTN|nr:ABC transporter substrate-binding protein [Nocardioides zeae]MDQ1105190.1 iron complex transport system substrate-binding protein [Nocardioides zeae]MDR6175095.1 iron complex transport system substrate-binding protein [Nocardioides zeae]MDR6211673.1 iron complex transport system substrate-binding protein [Nocardioides zeae]